MNRIKHFMILALALAMSLGAWAQQEVLLTTVTATGETSYSQSPDGIVTVTLNIGFYDDYDYGWLGGTVTVEANQGYTITRCVFKQNTVSIADDLAPFTATLSGYSTDNVSVETSTGHVNGDADHMIGITSIEVYGHQADPSPTVTHNADGSWSFTMPGYDAALNVTYYLQPNLAWTYNSAAMPAEGLTAYRGFELPVIGGIGASMDEDFLTALRGGTVSLRYGSVNGVVTFTDPNDRQSFTVTGSGLDTVYMVFDGNDDFLRDSAYFPVNILNPDTLTLAAQGNGTVSALVGGGEETLLTTVTATGLSDYSQSPDGIVTVTLNNISNYSSDYGWIDNGTVTVEAPQGYTITRCVFRQYDKTPLEDDQAPFTATIADYTVSAVTSTGQVYGVDVLSGDNMDGISSIEVYGYASNDSIVASATEGQYLVIPGAEVQVVATAQDGNYVSAWSDNRQPQHYTSDTNTITVGESMTLTATFAQNPLLTLEANGQGSVELEGYTPGETTYDITIDGNTVTNVSFPYQTTVSLHNLLMQVTGANPVIINSFQSYGSADVTITISEPFDGSRTISYYYDEIGAPILGSKTITCTANHSDAVYPDGVTAGTTANTFRVLPGTQLSVTATPGEGSYLAQWSDQTEPVEGDARLGSSHPYTMPAAQATLTATFNEIPVLTLASNNSEWGTVEMEGAGSGSSNGYTIKFSANGNTIVKENVTLPKTYQCEYGSPSEFDNIIRELYGWTGVHGNENAIPTVTGTDAITPGTESSRNYPKFTINSAFQGTATVTIGYTNSSWVSDNWPIEISFVPALPAGVLATTEEGTYRVLPGTQLSVTATPDPAHYFVNWDEETALNSNTAVEKTLTMGTDNTELTANFAAKPVLTLAQNESQWGEVTLEGYSSGTGSGTTLPDGVVAIGDNTYRVDYNTEVTVNAEATALHHVSGWQDQGGTELTGATYSDYFITTPENLFPAKSALTLTMTTDATARALFGINSYDVTAMVAAGQAERGTVKALYTDIQGESQTAMRDTVEVSAQGGSTTTLVALPANSCFDFQKWMVGTEEYANDTITVDAATVAEAYFVYHQYTGDTVADECDQFSWHGETYTAVPTTEPTFVYKTVGDECDSTVTLHLTLRYATTGDTTAVSCDTYDWYEHTGITASTETLTHLFEGANAVGCDSTVTLHLTVNYRNTGDTTAVECDQFSWYEHTGLTASTETLTHLFEGANQWGCDSTVTLHLTVNYRNTGVETATACDEYKWQGKTYTESNTLDQRVLSNRWGCDSTVTLNLTVNYHHDTAFHAQGTGSYTWGLGTNYEEAFTENNVYHRTIKTYQGCDSNVTLTVAIASPTTPIPDIYTLMNVTLMINHFADEVADRIDYIYYRWYKNGEVVKEGVDADSYDEGGATLNGCYYLEISTDVNRQYWAKSNELCFGTTGIEAVESVNFNVMPNPAVRGQRVSINVEGNADLQGARLTVFDATGRMVENSEFRNSNFEIQTSTLNSGVYMLRLSLRDGRVATKRLVVK